MTEEQSTYKTHWTVFELAKEAGVSPQYLRYLLREEIVKGDKPGGRDWIIADSEAQRWLVEWRASREK